MKGRVLEKDSMLNYYGVDVGFDNAGIYCRDRCQRK